jgi:hypothetical protein
MIRVLLTSGRGPGECRIALARTLGILAREAEAAGLDFDVATGPNPDGHGPASAIALLEGCGAEAFAATWIGSILWVARSPLRPHHKRKNWFIGVFKLEPRAVEPAKLSPADVRFEAFSARRTGRSAPKQDRERRQGGAQPNAARCGRARGTFAAPQQGNSIEASWCLASFDTKQFFDEQNRWNGGSNGR